MILKVFLLLLASGLGSSQLYPQKENNQTIPDPDVIYFPSSVPGQYQQPVPIILVQNPNKIAIDKYYQRPQPDYQQQHVQDRTDQPTPDELSEATSQNTFVRPSGPISGFRPPQNFESQGERNQDSIGLSFNGTPHRGTSQNAQGFRPQNSNGQQYSPNRRPTNGNDRIEGRPSSQTQTPSYQQIQQSQPASNNPNRRPSINANENFHNRPSTGSQEFTPQYRPTKRPQNYRPNYQDIHEQKPEDFKPITRFAWQCFKASNTPSNQNLVMSPLSPQLLLSHLAYGSEGQTQKEIIDAISYRNPRPIEHVMRSVLGEGGHRELQFATAFFVANDLQLNPQFRNLNNEVEVIQTDFRSPQKFTAAYNRWVQAKTKGHLPPINANVNPQTRMILSSAVHFKTPWVYKFTPATPGLFYNNENRPMQAQMMTLRKKLPYGTFRDMAEWCSIPYNSSDSMIIIKPQKDYNIEQVMSTMQPEDVDEIMDALYRDNYANVNLTMPKFKADSTTNLLAPLQKMGIRRASSAQSEITKLANEPLQVSNAVQQASMEVNEEGSIASSLTSFSVVALSFSPPTPNVEFMVDRPFLAMIINRERKFPYFIAKICTP